MSWSGGGYHIVINNFVCPRRGFPEVFRWNSCVLQRIFTAENCRKPIGLYGFATGKRCFFMTFTTWPWNIVFNLFFILMIINYFQSSFIKIMTFRDFLRKTFFFCMHLARKFGFQVLKYEAHFSFFLVFKGRCGVTLWWLPHPMQIYDARKAFTCYYG